MVSESFPLISIGIPVFNEARFISETLDSLINQDYPNIELIISDNASTDDTQQICLQYVTKYNWIHYHRFDKNYGPTKNFCYVLEHANGKYFMWAAGHDLWAKNYLTACVKMLETHPQAVIAYGSSQWINEHNAPFNREYGWVDTRGLDAISRYFTIFWGNMHPIAGVIRKETLANCPIINIVGADLIILSYLILAGDFIHAYNTVWCRREFRNEISHIDKLNRYKSKDFVLDNTLINILFPLAQLPIELIKVVLQSKHPISVRLSILLLLLISLPIRYLSGKRIIG